MNSRTRNSLVLLRLPFSFFLLPTFFFAWSQVDVVNTTRLILVFIILHLLVYPASNGYNSFMDRDTGSIGGIEHPPPPDRLLFYITIAMDALAILLALLVNKFFLLANIVLLVLIRFLLYLYPLGFFLLVICIVACIEM